MDKYRSKLGVTISVISVKSNSNVWSNKVNFNVGVA